MQATMNFADQKIEDKKRVEMEHKKNKMDTLITRMQMTDEMKSKFDAVMSELLENVAEIEEKHWMLEDACPFEARCTRKIDDIIEWMKTHLDSKQDDIVYRPFGKSLVNLALQREEMKFSKRILCTFCAWLITNRHQVHRREEGEESHFKNSGGKWVTHNVEVEVCPCGCGKTEVSAAKFACNVPFMVRDESDASCWLGFTIEFNLNPVENEAWFCINTTLYYEVMDNAKEDHKLIDWAMNNIFGPKQDWLAKVSRNLLATIDIVQKGRVESMHERRLRKEKEAMKELKEKKRREEEAERRRVDKEIQDRRAAERAARDEEERKVREADFAARVAAVAERERQNKEAEKAAKEEKARIAEEKAKIKAEQKEAERKAKFVNKKK
jgi:hypothetical protein